MKTKLQFQCWPLFALAIGFTAQTVRAQLPNAWQINDSTASGSLQYQTNLAAAQVSSAVTNGWRYELHSRMVSDNGSAAAHSMAFGDGVRRFYIFFDLNPAGELTAQLLGDSTYILTNNPAWLATDYHWHQLTYDPMTSNATYRVDDVEIAAWPGQVSVGQSNLVMWGANASAGQGVMNYHRAEFEIDGQGIIASYNAGVAGNPAVAPAPTTQGWFRFSSGSLAESPISPDTAQVTTLPAVQFTPDSVRLNGQVNPVGWPTVVWFEWGATTNYGNATANQSVGSGLTGINVDAVLSGLSIGANYHFRLVASNAVGVVRGANLSFVVGSFLPTPISGLPEVDLGSVAWGDYDNDGRLDFLLTGFENINPVSQLWRNTGSGFTNVTATIVPGLPGVYNSSVAWGDYDNDGRLDFLLTGLTNGVSGGTVSQLWRNTGNGFNIVTDAVAPGLPAVYTSSVAWGDYDNDGRLDFLLTGFDNTNFVSQLWRNTSNGFINVTATVAPGLPGVRFGSVAWADFDNDDRLDFLLTGTTNLSSGGVVSQLWRNTGSGFSNATATIAPGLPGVYFSSTAWGDFDNDGRLDFLLTGHFFDVTNTYVSQLWRNTGSGFSNVTATVAPGLPGVIQGSVASGDFDNDGRLDLLLTGNSYNGAVIKVSQLWRNTGSGFSNVTASVAPGLPGVYNSSVAWADYDNDGRLDFLLSGDAGFSGVLQLWRNSQPAGNSSPSAPFGLAAVTAGTHAALTWTAASDSETPTAGLSYNLRVGTSPGAGDVVSPQSLANGYRLGPGLGNVGPGTNRLVPVQFGVTHYWSVQTVDNGFAASAFAPEQSFTMNSVLTPPGGVPVPGDQNGDGVVSESELQLVLASYFPNSPWLHLTNVAGLGGTNVTFALTNSFAGAFTVEYTTNLADWLPLGPATPRYEFTDTNASAAPQRYYRLRWP